MSASDFSSSSTPKSPKRQSSLPQPSSQKDGNHVSQSLRDFGLGNSSSGKIDDGDNMQNSERKYSSSRSLTINSNSGSKSSITQQKSPLTTNSEKNAHDQKMGHRPFLSFSRVL